MIFNTFDRLQANPHNIVVYDINFNEPCTVKSKMNIYIGKNYKNYTLSLRVAQTSIYEKAMRFLKLLKENKTKKKIGTEKANLSSFVTVLICSYVPLTPPWTCTNPQRHEFNKMSAVNSKLLTVLQEVNLHRVAERFPDEVRRPLRVRHF